MAGDNDHEDESAAARAFADLRAEVTVMRKAVETLPTLIEEFSAPDYAPSFGSIAKALTSVEARLAGIEGHPALTMTPEAHGRAMARIVAASTDEATRALRDETGAVQRERQSLAMIVGDARTQEQQRKMQRWFGAGGLAIGLVLFPLLAAVAPGGSFLAALATGRFDRWQAGAGLMAAADPAGSRGLAIASRLMNANSEALQACSDAAKKAGKEQKCTITVSVPVQ